MVKFLSPKYLNLHQPLRRGLFVEFRNGMFETDDDVLINELRELIKVQLSGGLATIQEANETEGTRVTGVIHLELDGIPSYKLVLGTPTSLSDLMDRIKTVTQIPLAQVNVNRLDAITPLQRGSVHPDSRYTPDFAHGDALVINSEPAALPSAPQYSPQAPAVKKANNVARHVATKKLRAKKGEKVNAS